MHRNHSIDRLAECAKILGLNRTRDNDLRPMVRALSFHSWNNTREENARRDAAIYAMRYWREFQNLCGRLRSGRSAHHADNHVSL